MSNGNYKNYIKAISKGSDIHRNTDKDIIFISLDEQSIELIKKIKSFMEWDLNTAINSAITYFYKTNESSDVKDNVLNDLKGEDVKFTPTFKNRQRITKEIELNKLDEKYYIVLIHYALKSFSKVLYSKHK